MARAGAASAAGAAPGGRAARLVATGRLYSGAEGAPAALAGTAAGGGAAGLGLGGGGGEGARGGGLGFAGGGLGSSGRASSFGALAKGRAAAALSAVADACGVRRASAASSSCLRRQNG